MIRIFDFPSSNITMVQKQYPVKIDWLNRRRLPYTAKNDFAIT